MSDNLLSLPDPLIWVFVYNLLVFCKLQSRNWNMAHEPQRRNVVQLLSHVHLFATPWTAAHQASLSLYPGVCSDSGPRSQWCHPAISSSVIPFSSCLQSFPAPGFFPVSQLFPSGDRSIGASNEYSGLISFRIEWFDLLAVQGTLKSLL